METISPIETPPATAGPGRKSRTTETRPVSPDTGPLLVRRLVESVAAEEETIQQICAAVGAGDGSAVLRFAEKLAGMRGPPSTTATCA